MRSDDIPEIGSGGSVQIGSDRYAVTVTHASHNRITVQWDDSIPTENCELPNGRQEYTYEPDPNGYEMTFTKRKNGKWCQRGSDMRADGCRLHIGNRDTYRDPHF